MIIFIICKMWFVLVDASRDKGEANTFAAGHANDMLDIFETLGRREVGRYIRRIL